MRFLVSVLVAAIFLSGCEATPRSSGVVVKKSQVNDEFVYQPYDESQYARPAAAAPVAVAAAEPLGYVSSQVDSTAAVPAPVGEVVAPKAPEPECWIISPNQKRVSVALEEWAMKAGWTLLWEDKMDFDIEAGGTFCSSFEEAVETVLSTYRNSDHPLHPNFYSNRVVQVVSGAK